MISEHTVLSFPSKSGLFIIKGKPVRGYRKAAEIAKKHSHFEFGMRVWEKVFYKDRFGTIELKLVVEK